MSIRSLARSAVGVSVWFAWTRLCHSYNEELPDIIDDYVGFAFIHPVLKFLVTHIGCGIDAFMPEETVPPFKEAFQYGNFIPSKVRALIYQNLLWKRIRLTTQSNLSISLSHS